MEPSGNDLEILEHGAVQYIQNESQNCGRHQKLEALIHNLAHRTKHLLVLDPPRTFLSETMRALKKYLKNTRKKPDFYKTACSVISITNQVDYTCSKIKIVKNLNAQFRLIVALLYAYLETLCKSRENLAQLHSKKFSNFFFNFFRISLTLKKLL